MLAMFVIKRDGRKVQFEPRKITNAIFKAFSATGEGTLEDAKRLSRNVAKQIERKKLTPSVEEIQDRVELSLMRDGKYRTAKAYILYREQHKNIREIRGLMSDTTVVDDYLDRNDWMVKENSNMTFSLQGLNNYLSSKIVSNYWLRKLYPPEIRDAHISGDFHIHDLQQLSVYCVGWDLNDLLMSGFTGVPSKITSKPAKHFRTALGQVVNFMYTLQGEAAGAQALSNVDTLLAPFIRYDDLTYKQVKQNLQEFMFNMNVSTRVGFQCPFSNVTLDLKVPAFMRNEPAVIGGEPVGEPLGDFQSEVDMFDRAFGEIMCEGDGRGNPFSFPIPTLNITRDFDWDNPIYDPLWQMTAKYGIPYFSNFVNSDMSPEDVRSMCCRLRLDKRELMKRGGGLFGANPLTGSIGVVTINMPRIGYTAEDDYDFFERLDELMELAKNSLEIKRNILDNYTEKGLYPYVAFYLRDMKERFGTYWKNHFSTIGLIGMNECLKNFLGKDITTHEGKNFAIGVLKHMRTKILEFQEETGNIYNLEATPAEGTSYRLARIDKKTYPDIATAGKNTPYYTNSTHLPVDFDVDIFDALEMQDDLQTLYTGGTVMHLYLGEFNPPVSVVKGLVKKISSGFRLPYFTLTPTFSICPNHGYMSGEHSTCPQCNSRCEVYSRVVGYLRPISQWNDGKVEEFKQRNMFEL